MFIWKFHYYLPKLELHFALTFSCQFVLVWQTLFLLSTPKSVHKYFLLIRAFLWVVHLWPLICLELIQAPFQDHRFGLNILCTFWLIQILIFRLDQGGFEDLYFRNEAKFKFEKEIFGFFLIWKSKSFYELYINFQFANYFFKQGGFEDLYFQNKAL